MRNGTYRKLRVVGGHTPKSLGKVFTNVRKKKVSMFDELLGALKGSSGSSGSGSSGSGSSGSSSASSSSGSSGS